MTTIVVGSGFVLAPGRLDHQVTADAHHREVLLPRLGPVLLVDDARRQLADVPELERLEMAEVAPHTFHRRVERPTDQRL